MSKVIKSNNASLVDSEKKMITLKKLINDAKDADININDDKQLISTEIDELEQQKIMIEQSLQEAENIRQQAQAEYEQMQQQLNEEMVENQKKAEEMFIQAEQNGYNEGFQQGLTEGQKQYESFIEEAQNIIAKSEQAYYQRLEDAEPVILQLGLKVAEKIIKDSLSNDHEIWLSIVKGVLNEVKELTQVKIYVHPDWFELTLANKDQLQLLLPNCEQLFIFPDVHLNENGCVIETPFGRIDATVDSQLTEITEALTERLKELSESEGS